MFANPIGTFLTRFDAALLAAMDGGIGGLSAAMVAPLTVSISLWFAVVGLQVANGKMTLDGTFWIQLGRVATVLWLCTNTQQYNFWVRGFFFDVLPGYLSRAAISHVAAANNLSTSDVHGAAAALNTGWSLMWAIAGAAWGRAGVLDVSTKLACFGTLVTGSLALAADTLIYLGCRTVLAVVVELGVVAVGLSMFETTRPIFDRWLGKMIALVFTLLAAVVAMQIVLTGDQYFLDQIVNSGPTTASGAASDIQNLVSMAVWLLMGAFALFASSAVGYSLGTGVATSALGSAMNAVVATRLMPSGPAATGRAAVAEAAPNYQLSQAGSGAGAHQQLGGGPQLSLPAPPPPALSGSFP